MDKKKKMESKGKFKKCESYLYSVMEAMSGMQNENNNEYT